MTIQVVVATRDSYGFPYLIVTAGSSTLSHNPTSNFQQLLETIVRKGCGSGCDRCPPCPTKTTPTPTTLTLTSNGSEMTFSLGAGLTGYVATGVLLASWLGLWLAAKAGWVEVRVTNPPSWCPFPSSGDGRGPAKPEGSADANNVTTTTTTPAVVVIDRDEATPPAATSTVATLGMLPTAPAMSLPSGPPSYSFYSAGEGESIYSEPASWV